MIIKFWLLFSLACLLWYMTVTGYVAVKGFGDIKTMFKKLGQDKENE
jgi:hypothetical protein